jgi:hypothetical protein
LLDRSPELLASGDVRALADALASMRRALAVVGGVPEFAAGAARVASLTDSLEALVQPALSSALAARDGASARELVDVLRAAGRDAALQRVYVAARLQPLLQQWLPLLRGARGGGHGHGYEALLSSHAVSAPQGWALGLGPVLGPAQVQALALLLLLLLQDAGVGGHGHGCEARRLRPDFGTSGKLCSPPTTSASSRNGKCGHRAAFWRGGIASLRGKQCRCCQCSPAPLLWPWGSACSYAR